MTGDNSCEDNDDNESSMENTEDNAGVGVLWSSAWLDIDSTAEKPCFFVLVTRMDAIMDLDEETDRANTGVLSCAPIIDLLSEITFSIFVDDGTMPGELAIDDNPSNNVVWPLTSCVLEISFTVFVEYNSVLSDIRVSATLGELL